MSIDTILALTRTSTIEEACNAIADLKSRMRVVTEERNAALAKAEKLGLQLENERERLHAAELRLIDSPVVWTFEKGLE